VRTLNETVDGSCSEKADESSTADQEPSDPNDIQLQLDEITALKSIFDEKVLTIDETQLKGRFLVEPILSKSPYLVVYRDRSLGNSASCEPEEHFSIEHLPPIELYFELPKHYPFKSHPMFLISCKWLTLSDLGIDSVLS